MNKTILHTVGWPLHVISSYWNLWWSEKQFGGNREMVLQTNWRMGYVKADLATLHLLKYCFVTHYFGKNPTNLKISLNIFHALIWFVEGRVGPLSVNSLSHKHRTGWTTQLCIVSLASSARPDVLKLSNSLKFKHTPSLFTVFHLLRPSWTGS